MLSKLRRSKFRSSFRLSEKDLNYINKKELEAIKLNAEKILDKRIRILGKNDGKQTPYKGHPVFIAQHATATCCRKCIEKWYKIPKNKVLSYSEMNCFINLIMQWINKEVYLLSKGSDNTKVYKGVKTK